MRNFLHTFIIAGFLCFSSAAMSAQEVTSLQLAVSTKPTTPVTEGKLAVGGTRTLVTIVEPASAANLPVKWSIADENIAALDATVAGKFRGMAPGITTVTAEVGGVTASYKLDVQQKDAKVGDYYFSNNTWESSGIVPGKECIGVIFYVNPDNKQSGKIVSLDEATQLKWSTANVSQPGATSEFDGLENLDAIKTVSNWKESFDAEAWCASKTDGGLNWYLPAIAELRQLFAASCGLTWVKAGADEANKQINDWNGLNQTMLPGDNINPYPTERATFNKKFTNIGKTALNADGTTRYWSSTQYADEFAYLLSFEGGYTMMQPRQYFHVGNTRAIAQFPKNNNTSGITSVNADNAVKTTLFPNPAESTTILSSVAEIKEIEVYSLTGARMNVGISIENNSAILNVEALSRGTYLVVTTDTTSARNSVKLIKM